MKESYQIKNIAKRFLPSILNPQSSILNQSSILILCLAIFFATTAHAKTKPFRVILDWFINPDHAPLFVAKEQGFFKQHGLDVIFIPPASPDDPPKLVAAEKADLGITYEPSFKEQIKQGLPLIQIGTLIATPLECLVALQNGSIHRIEDLKGKRIGYSSAASNFVVLKTMLNDHHLTLNDVQLINVHYDLVQALLSHRIDAFSGGMRNFEPAEITLAGQTPLVFYPEDHGMPLYNELIFITNTSHRNDPRIKAFFDALREGVVYLVNHPNESFQAFVKDHPELNNDLNKKAWFDTLTRFALRPGK